MKPKLFTQEQVKELLSAISTEKVATQVTKFKAEFEKDPERFGAFKIIVTTSDEDRMGDVVAADGWDLKHYLNNPIVLWAHAYDELPVGITLSLEVTDAGLVAEGFFAPEEANPKAQQIRKLYDMGFINTASVGFIPRKFDEEDRNKILEQELLEWSFVPVPANPHALNVLNEKGIEVSELINKGILTKVDGQGNGDDGNNGGGSGDDKGIERAKKNIGNTLSKLNTDVGNLITRAFETISSELSAIQSNDNDAGNPKALNEFKVKLAIESLEKLMKDGLEIKGVLDEVLSANVQDAATHPCQGKGQNEKEALKVLKLINSATSKAIEEYKKRHNIN